MLFVSIVNLRLSFSSIYVRCFLFYLLFLTIINKSFGLSFNLILCIFSFYGFFFFKQKTAYEMRISDWSSDVCSSDLRDLARHAQDDPGTSRARKICDAHGRRDEPPHGIVGRGDDQGQSCRGRGIGRGSGAPRGRGGDRGHHRRGRPRRPGRGRAERGGDAPVARQYEPRSEEHTSELQSLMRISYAAFCLQKKTADHHATNSTT